MEQTPRGTSVGVEDPYEHAGFCDHLTDDGRCRFAIERFEADPTFARKRRADDYSCPVVSSTPGSEWSECPNYQSTTTGESCTRCDLDERRTTGDERPLLEEHHLSYSTGEADHEITVTLCRWCHAKVHNSWATISDQAAPPPEAIAAKEQRRSREQDELEFETAAERYLD